MESLNTRIKDLEDLIKILNNQIKILAKIKEENKTKPYSKVKNQLKLDNLDLVFDAKTGFWRTYAIYKDDPEEEE